MKRQIGNLRKRLWYPKKEDIIINNKKVLEIFKAHKSDIHKVKSPEKIPLAIQESKKKKGDVEDKASVLMRRLNKEHPFISGNKRTAYFTANQFICKNKGYLVAKKRDKQRDICLKAREGRITDKEIADWLREADKNKVYGRERYD
jgi:death-on-curing family protein